MNAMHTRTFPLDDIRIRSEGDGRTVEAYAAVFDTDSEIHDADGHYIERNAATAFNKTIAERGNRFGCFYNHALTIHGTPSERGSVPLGTPLEIRPDGKGLLTVTRYNRTPFADDILESIRNGDIRGMSYTGRFLQSDAGPGGRPPYRPNRSGKLTTVTRTEIALKEYGPTPFPAFEDATIVGVRALRMLGQLRWEDLDEDQRAQLVASLRTTEDPAATPLEPAAVPATGDDPAGTGEPPPADGEHSGPAMTRAEARARLMKSGVLLP